jgi:hypothetical protein
MSLLEAENKRFFDAPQTMRNCTKYLSALNEAHEECKRQKAEGK